MTSSRTGASAASYPNPNDSIDLGRRQLQLLWRRFSRQLGMTQPKWIRLAASVMPGPQHLHSSQIGGLATGKLREPAPKCLLVIGQLNLSVAASALRADGQRAYPDVQAPRFPEEMRSIWEHLIPMVDRYGTPLGPAELFMVATGLIDLGLDSTRDIPVEAEAAASAALGRHVRLGLAAQGVDFLSEMPQLREAAASVEPLLMGRPVPGDTLIADLPALASLIRTTDADLWAVIAEATGSYSS